MIRIVFALLLLLASAAVFAAEVKTVRNAVYGRAGGHDLIMHITETDDGADFKPAMVCIHGGGFSAGDAESMVPWAGEMAKLGFKCFSIEYRLAGEALWPAQTEDCKTAVRHIRANAKKYGIDPNRIGAFGHSAGGTLACMLGVMKPGKYEGEAHPAVSSVVQGVINYCGRETFTEGAGPRLLDTLFGKAAEGREERIKAASPLTNVSRASAPHLLIHGDADDVVSYRLGEPYRDALRACGVRCDWLLVEGGWHIIDNYDVWQDIGRFCREVFFK